MTYNEIGKKDTFLFIEKRNWDSRKYGGTVPAFLSPWCLSRDSNQSPDTSPAHSLTPLCQNSWPLHSEKVLPSNVLSVKYIEVFTGKKKQASAYYTYLIN